MKLKKFLAIAAAVLTMSCMTANVYADTLENRDGLKYRISDSGENLGLYTGWTTKGDERYYFKDGVRKKNCWLTSKGKRKYFLQSDGTLATGKVTIDGIEYEFDEKGVIVPDEWGLTATAKDVTPTSCTVFFTQSGGNPTGELETGTFFKVEQYKDGKWTDVDELPREYDLAWPAVSFSIDKNKSTGFFEKWDLLYGELSAGKYRIGKDIMDFRKSGDYDRKMYYAYFEIDSNSNT